MSTLKVNTIQNTSGGSSSTPEQIEQGRCKAWVNWNGQGTVAIRDSFGVGSITDNGTGAYTVNFSSNMSNTSYYPNGICSQSGTSVGHFDAVTFHTFNAGSVRIHTFGDPDQPHGETDCVIACAGIFGDN